MNSEAPQLSANLEELYIKEDWKSLIEKVIASKDQYPAAQFHFNLGSIFAKKKDFAYARFHLEKSLRLSGHDSKVKNNLNYVVQKLETPKLWDRSSFMGRIDASFEYIAPSLIAIPFILIAFTLLYWLRHRSLRLWFVVYMALVLAFGGLYHHVDSLRFAVVLKNAPLKEGPSALFGSVGEIRAGTKLILGKNDNGFCYIREPADFRGWVRVEDLGIY